MPNFLVVPSANVNGGGEVTSLTGAVVDTDLTLAPLVNGTEYRAFVLANPSPPFTPSAAVSFAAAYVSNAVDVDTFEATKTFNGVAIGAADASRKLYIVFVTHCIETSPVTLSVNGGGALSPIASVRPTGGQNRRQILLFEADVPTGTTANFVFSNSVNEFQGSAMAVIRAVGAHTSGFATNDDTDANATATAALATLAGDAVFMAVCSLDATAPNYTPQAGFTEHFEVDPNGFGNRSFTLNSGTAAGGSPETFTTTSAATNNHSVLVLRLRAT